MAYAYDNELRDENGDLLGTFSSHWAACAAMIRLHTPDFKSLSGDKLEDLEIERRMKE